ncbi:DUF4336 domain-containing protein [Bradyrhizobium oligotrophicum]|uniref:DUF4336 domain-containing protein n=1 Tax=Bradyrhizobium oligotrophicum TaxID=44255 RepID=UPI003EB846F5
MLREFGPEIWIADGGRVTVAGFCYPTRMAVVRLSDGGLFVWSPVDLTDGMRAAVNAIGAVRHIVAPNSLHHLFLPAWADAYPAARLHAPPGLRKKRPDIAFHTDLGDTAPSDWAADIAQVLMTGNLITTEVVFFHARSRTVLFADLLQQIPAGLITGWRAWIARADLMVGPEPNVPRKFRLAFVDRRAARAAVGRVLAWRPERVLMAHGTPVLDEADAYLRRAFGWLLG